MTLKEMRQTCRAGLLNVKSRNFKCKGESNDHMIHYEKVLGNVFERGESKFCAVFTAQKIMFTRSWNIIESSKRPCKYHLSINVLGEKKNFSVTSKYHLSMKFLTQKETVFPIAEKFKTRTSQ